MNRGLAFVGALRVGVWLHHGSWRGLSPKGSIRGFLSRPPPRGRRLLWERLELEPKEVAGKLQALKAHRSQMEILGRFKQAFVRKNELLTRPLGEARE